MLWPNHLDITVWPLSGSLRSLHLIISPASNTSTDCWLAAYYIPPLTSANEIINSIHFTRQWLIGVLLINIIQVYPVNNCRCFLGQPVSLPLSSSRLVEGQEQSSCGSRRLFHVLSAQDWLNAWIYIYNRLLFLCVFSINTVVCKCLCTLLKYHVLLFEVKANRTTHAENVSGSVTPSLTITRSRVITRSIRARPRCYRVPNILIQSQIVTRVESGSVPGHATVQTATTQVIFLGVFYTENQP